MWKPTVFTLLCAVFASPSYAASLGRDAEAVPTLRRHARSLQYGGGSVDSLNHVGLMAPVDAYLDQTDAPPEEDSSEEDLGDLMARMDQVKKDLTLDFAQREEKVMELQEQIAAMETPHTPLPVNPAEAGAEAQEQQPQQEQPQADPAQTAEQTAEAAEQAVPQADAPPPPDPAPSGPDGSNTEDGDGNGNNNNNNNAADPPAAAENNNNNNNNNNGGAEAGGQQDSGAGAADPPSTPEPVPYEPPQNNDGNGNGIDEDTKS